MNAIRIPSTQDGSLRNLGRVAAAAACGCFHCQAVFPAGAVRQWIDNGQTALCPECGVDAVLPGVTDAATLRRRRDAGFAA